MQGEPVGPGLDMVFIYKTTRPASLSADASSSKEELSSVAAIYPHPASTQETKTDSVHPCTVQLATQNWEEHGNFTAESRVHHPKEQVLTAYPRLQQLASSNIHIVGALRCS
ncbi:hypothetical protein O181_018737 [Austropuccinia psidii MF-1]|uniref:Uncharacterized protein n=1 Tax=Austropuccinia psidii MF-1 TaxID=1389203 RepID=A0A9Q3GTS5_9BASI|nr:hypothetical protein [Austropuccinia psidii MF-1]